MTKSKGARQVLAFIMALALALSLVPAISLTASADNDVSDADRTAVNSITAADLEWEFVDEGEGTGPGATAWPQHYQAVVSYVADPVLPDLQVLNIYVPLGYFDEDGNIDEDAVVNGYTIDTAPIVYQNSHTGWMQSDPASANGDYLNAGFIHIGVGARGSTSEGDEEGVNYNKSPAAIVDLKAGVRFLRLNDDVIPGDSERIISWGASGGGATSSLLGATGNMEDYYPYLYEIGAAGIGIDEDGNYYSTVDDNVFAAQCFCPITDLDNADLAYSWVRYPAQEEGISATPNQEAFTFSDFQKEILQKDLSDAYIDYVNNVLSFDGLTLGENGRSGTYYVAVMSALSDSLNNYLDYNYGEGQSDARQEYVETYENFAEWGTYDEETGLVSITDLDAWVEYGNLPARNKNIPGFDTLAATAENDSFGYPGETEVHYSASIAQVMLDNFDEYMEEASETEQTQIKQYLLDLFTEAELKAALGDDLDSIFDGFTNNDERVAYIRNQAYLYNSLAILTEENPDVAQYWRIRVGTADYHTAYSVTFNLATLLEEQGADVDYALIWEGGHGGHEEIEQGNGLFADWVNEICAEADDGEDDSDPFDLAAALAKGTYAWELSEDGTHYDLKGVNFETVITNDEYQEFNYYVPAGYVTGIDETTGQLIIDETAEINGYTAATAPIVFENYNVGWASGTAKAVTTSYIAEGFIHVGCGSRSRDATNEDGTIITGKAPTAVVDLKAGVRYLRYNADVLPGDMDKIVSVGGSGAGQMSTILGASGDMDEYYPYLYETGAVGVEYDETTGNYTSTISDAVYATMAYCPIADINNADMAYAWMRYDSSVNGSKYDFTDFQLALEKDLAYAFCEYINSLNLVDEDGNALGFDVENGEIVSPRQGSYYDKILENMSDALNLFAENTEWPYSVTSGRGDTATTIEYADMDAFLETYTDTSEWLTKNSDGTYSITDMAGFLTGTGLERNKDIPGFDTLGNSAENTAFGTPDMAASHYSASVAAVLKENYDTYKDLEGFDAEQVDLYIEQANDEYVINQAYLMNATEIMLNVANGTEKATPSTYWRTRNGTADQHTSFTIAYNLCLAALANDYDVDYSLVWAMGHGTNEGTTTGTFEEWVNEICKPDSGDDEDEVVLTDFSTAASEAQTALADAATLRALGNYTAIESGYYTYTANGNTAVLYVGEDAQTNEFLTIIAMPDGVTTAEAAVKYAIQEGWPEQMDHYGEYMVLLPAPEAGWGTDADADAAYLAACKPSSNLTTFYGCYYLVGYGAAAGPMQIYAASSPISISAQVYIDATGDVSEALAAAGESIYSYSTAPTEGNYVDSVSYKDVAIPTYFIGAGNADDIEANIAYWQAAAAADNLTTAYSDVEVAVEYNATSETDAATAEDLLNNFVRYESSTVYGNNLKERKPIADTENAYVIDWDWTDPATGYVWNREVLVYVGETAGEDAPVVYALHGATNSSNLFYNATSWTEVADELGYIIVFLNGTASSAARAGYLMWQTNAEGRSSAAPSETVPSELDYILSAIELVDSRFDTAGSKRRYITGNSAGSMNSHQVAQTLSDYFTALGTTSGIIMSNGSTIGYEYEGTTGYTYKWDGIEGSNSYTKIETGLDTFFPAYTIMGTNDHWTAAVGYVDYDSLVTDDDGNFVGIYPGSKSTKSEASEYNMPFRTQLYFLMRNGAVDLGDITYYDVLDAINGGVEDFAEYYDAYVKAGFEENMEITNEFNLGEPVDGIYSLDFVTEEGYYSEDAINEAIENSDVDRYTTYTWYNDSGVPVYQWSANYTRSHEMTPDDEWLIAVTWFEHWTMKDGVYYYDGVAANAEDAEEPVEPEEPDDDTDPFDLAAALAKGTYAWELSEDETYYQLLGVDYEAIITNEIYQEFNYYVPAGYVTGIDEAGQLIIDETAEINGYTAATAPIVFQNNNAGWASGWARTVNTTYIDEGFIFVGCGSRSRDATNEDGTIITGKAPTAVVDLKAGVRYIRYNADVLPGDMDKIVSVGGSGAGQMSSILGASGDMDEYYPYLYEAGAVGVEYDETKDTYKSTISDAIYATMAYCPIADLNNADMAYAWMRYDSSMDGSRTFTAFQDALEVDLAYAFCEYINSLNLVDEDGNALSFAVDDNGDIISPRQGSYYDKILENISDALNAYIEYYDYSAEEAAEYMSSYAETEKPWYKVNEDGTYSVTDMAGFLTGTGLDRNKDIPGFDTLGNDAENTAFGTPDMAASHYSASVAAVLKENYDTYKGLEGFDADQVDLYIEQANDEYVINQAYLMNATEILLNVANGTEESNPSTYWRTRNGTADQHTSFTIAYNLCLAALANDYDVDYSLVWAMGHGSQEGESTGTFVQWVNEICKPDSGDEPVTPEEPEDDTITLDIEEALAEEIATKTILNVTVDGEARAVTWYAAPYVSNPNRADDQKINIYIPENATSDSPIMFYVNNSGWQSNSYPTTTITDGKEYVSTSDSDRVGVALSEGYIIVSYGARSRSNGTTEVDGEELYLGHSPATMTDTKAAIRYLRYNAEALDLNTDEIIITGTSGGGALSTVIAASGNSSDFYESLYEIGAAGISYVDGEYVNDPECGDNVLAVIAYCPITDFRGADMAYEWLFYDTRVRLVEEADGTQLYDGITNDELLEYSADLKKSYETYFNGLDLVDDEGNALTTDNLLDHIEALMIDEFNTTLKQYIESEGSVNAAVEAMIADIQGKAAYEKVGNNWLIFETDSNGDYTGGYTYDIAEHLYFLANNQTLKVVNAFSNLGLEWGSQNEDNLFGSATDVYSPFEYLSWLLDSTDNEVGYDDTGYTWDEYMDTPEGEYLSMQIRMTSALDYLVDPGDATPATYWYVRHGVLDRDTSFAVESSLFYSLYSSDAIDDDNINIGFAWLQGHAGNYDVQEAYTWLDAVLNGTEETEGPDVTVTTSVSNKAITVNVDSDEEADFIIFLTNENGEAVEVKTVSGTSETVKFTGLTNGEEYTVTVTAVNSDGGETIVAETATPKSSSSGGSSSGTSTSGGSSGGTTTDTGSSGTTTTTGTFSDVSTDDYYYDAVEWAVANGITTGTSDTTFSPEIGCSRAQIVTFLWRDAGSPETEGENPFTDVADDAYYYDAILWAVANGITNGTTDTTFSPDDTCTRGQIVTFLYRYAGASAEATATFSDVDVNFYYAAPVAWAVANGITNGTSDTTFSPNDACTRAQVVTFLYRYSAV